LQPESSPRILSLRYDGTCSVCETDLARRTRAWWYRDVKKIVCFNCRPEQHAAVTEIEPPRAESSESGSVAQPLEPVGEGGAPLYEQVVEDELSLMIDGEAGASARREGQRRRAKRERETLDRHPRLGKLILAVSDEPQAVRSWAKGAVGEEALGANLNKLASERLVILHDRRVPGSRANIDHIAIAPGGVFVIDAKHYSGRVDKRDLGGWFSTDLRLYVGRRDCTKLVLGSEDQAEVVRDAIAPLGFADIPVRPVLCFVGAEWGLFASPFKHGSVLVTWPKYLYDLLKKEADVETAAIQETARHVAATLSRA
jgi:Nuclease-related domain